MVNPIKSPPKPVGDDAFFQVPEIEQLPRGAYDRMGLCKAIPRKFYIFQLVQGKKDELVVGYTPLDVEPTQRILLDQCSIVPPPERYAFQVVQMDQMPTGSYELTGIGHVKPTAHDNPIHIYIFECSGFCLATTMSIPHINVHSVLIVEREGENLLLKVDRNGPVLTPDLGYVDQSVYAWVDGNLVLQPEAHA